MGHQLSCYWWWKLANEPNKQPNLSNILVYFFLFSATTAQQDGEQILCEVKAADVLGLNTSKYKLRRVLGAVCRLTSVEGVLLQILS